MTGEYKVAAFKLGELAKRGKQVKTDELTRIADNLIEFLVLQTRLKECPICPHGSLSSKNEFGCLPVPVYAYCLLLLAKLFASL